MASPHSTRWYSEYVGNYSNLSKQSKLTLFRVALECLCTSICLNSSILFSSLQKLPAMTIGQLIACFYFGLLSGSLFSGALVSRYSTHKIIGISTISYGLVFLHLAINLPIFIHLMGMTILGFLGAIISTSNSTNLMKVEESEKLKLINLEMVTFNLSFSLGAVLLLDLSAHNTQTVLNTLSVLMITTGLMLLNSKYKHPSADKKGLTWQQPNNPKQFILLLLSVFSIGLIFSLVKVTYAPTIASRYSTYHLAGLVASINPWTIFFLQPFISNRLEKNLPYPSMAIGSLCISLGFLGFGLIPSLLLGPLFILMMTFGEIAYSPLSKRMALTFFSHHQASVAISCWKATFLGAGLFGPLLSGYLLQHYTEASVWIVTSLLGVFCFFALTLRKKQREGIEVASNGV